MIINFKIFLPPAMPVISLPIYSIQIFLAQAMQSHPVMKGILLICIDFVLPNHSAKTPERMEPRGFVIAPRLAEIMKKMHIDFNIYIFVG